MLWLYNLYLSFICYKNWLQNVYNRTHLVLFEGQTFTIDEIEIKIEEKLSYNAGLITLEVDNYNKTIYFNYNRKRIKTNLKQAKPPRGILINDYYYTTKEEDFLQDVIDEDF